MKFILKFIAVLIIIVVILGGAGYLLLNLGRSVDVEWTQEDLDSLVSKIGVDVKGLENLSVENIARNSYRTSGVNQVDAAITSEEFSAMVAAANDESGPLRDFKVNFMEDGELEMSFKLSPDIAELIEEAGILEDVELQSVGANYLNMTSVGSLSLTQQLVEYLSQAANNKPIYAKGTLERSGYNNVDVRIDEIRVGIVPLDRATVDLIEEKTEFFVNNFLSSDNGFRLEELRIDDGKLYYKGTLPEEITGIPIS